jgi:peptidylglycine monooxygenase
MPKANPKEPETYLCTPLRLDKQNTYYITGFEPRAEKKTAHHMLLYGCKTPGRQVLILLLRFVLSWLAVK